MCPMQPAYPVAALALAAAWLAPPPAPAQAASAVAASPGSSTATVTIGLGGRARMNALAFRPLRIVEDSRCPSLVSCVWRGRLRVELAVAGRGRMIVEDGRPVAIAGGTLTLAGATPLSRQGERVPPRAYRLTFTFQR